MAWDEATRDDATAGSLAKATQGSSGDATQDDAKKGDATQHAFSSDAMRGCSAESTLGSSGGVKTRSSGGTAQRHAGLLRRRDAGRRNVTQESFRRRDALRCLSGQRNMKRCNATPDGQDATQGSASDETRYDATRGPLAKQNNATRGSSGAAMWGSSGGAGRRNAGTLRRRDAIRHDAG